ncbi:uncharacterized protein LOC121416947 [Lytechinus variegatus]|uniref:uncharacterized protein LOC121416947 n=1 Tax=Lytechinus variegatus TaxID=7654 RepID=UPI001BB11D6A|nr:uncharacterized protein LOC121416947 [Lytechinus variegatus]
MAGVSETDEVAICPTVNVGGSFEGVPVEMTLSHCAELSQAALEGKGKVVVYHKSEKGSDQAQGGGGVSRRELSPSECTITKDKLRFDVDKPGLYTASMKDDMCVGKRVAMLAFLPREMPKNRRPVIHLQFYFPFGELGQRLCDEWTAKDCVCVKDETTFILKHIGQDAKVEFKNKFTQELSSTLETETLEIISYECLDFELDYYMLKTNDVDATVRIIQGECRAEIEIQGTLTVPEPEPVPEMEPEPVVEPEPEEPLPPKEPIRVPHKVSDKMIAEVAKYKISSDRFSVLVNALGFSTKDFGKAVSDNISSTGRREGYIGTKNILTRWRNKTEVAKQRPELREAFIRSNLPHLTKRYLKIEHDFLD